MQVSSFASSQLTLLRELEGVPKSTLATDLGVSPATITGWENGSRSPTQANVRRLALRFAVDPEFFAYVDNQRNAELPFFRSLRSTTASERSKSSAYTEVAERIIRSLDLNVNFPAFGGFEAISTESPEKAAQDLRLQLGSGSSPIRNLMEQVEDLGIFVVFGPPSSRSVDAFSRFAIPNPVIVLNPAKHDFYRQRFDLAHELGHLILHSGDQVGTKQIESEAHRFAGELLAPSEALADALPKRADQVGWKELRYLKEHWGISMQALLYRAHSLEIMSEGDYRNAMMTLSKRGWRRSEPGNQVVLETPTLLPSAVKLLIDFGYTTEQLAANAGVPTSYFDLVVRQTPQLYLATNPERKHL